MVYMCVSVSVPVACLRAALYPLLPSPSRLDVNSFLFLYIVLRLLLAFSLPHHSVTSEIATSSDQFRTSSISRQILKVASPTLFVSRRVQLIVAISWVRQSTSDTTARELACPLRGNSVI